MNKTHSQLIYGIAMATPYRLLLIASDIRCLELLSQVNVPKSQTYNLFSKLLSLDRQRVKDWSYVQAILAACWAEQDGGDWPYFVRCAELIESL